LQSTTHESEIDRFSLDHDKLQMGFTRELQQQLAGSTFYFVLALNAREKTLGAGEKLEDFETNFGIKWC
jgi:hypothetical protein